MGANCSFSKDEEQKHIGPNKKQETNLELKRPLYLYVVCVYIDR